jgi:hypothetical protein
MKKLLVLIALVSSYFFCAAQRMESDRIYWVALEKYTHALDTLNFRKAEGDDSKIIYLEKPDYIDSIPTMVNGYQIVPITNSNEHILYKKHKNTLIHTRVSAVVVEDSLLRISFIPYIGKLKKRNHYFLAVSGGTSVYFKFDCTKQRFAFYKVNNWGI